MRLRGVDLFCGGGGSGSGARRAGVDIVCAVDAWSVAVETYKKNFPKTRVIQATLDDKSGASMLGDIGDIDLILASPECTNHTCAKGARPRDEESRRTANYVVNFARTLAPRWIVLENVVQMRGWQGFTSFTDDLRALGYNVLQQVLDSVDFGVPQTRRRLFILCDREAQPPTVTPARNRPRQARSAWEVIQVDGPWASRPLYSNKRAQGTLERARRAMDQLGDREPFLIVYYGSDGSGGWQTLDRPLRTLTTLDRFGLVTWAGETPMLRMLQVPELKQAMGFADSFLMPYGSRRDQIKLLGNGVCPPVMQAVVEALTQNITFVQAAE